MTVNKARSNRWLIIAGIVFVFCIVCFSILFIGSIITSTRGTSTPTIEIISTQTNVVILPTAMITSTNLPTLTQPPVTPPTAIATTPVTPIPTLAIINIPTNTLVFILATNTAASIGGTCSCSGDIYNCTDFSSHASAQACFDYCVQQGAGDIHRLDRDHDGLACESN